MTVRPGIHPALQYEDCPAAIAFLERAYGFTTQARFDNPDGSVAHAQLVLDGNLIMVGSFRPDNIYGIGTPARLGGVTGSLSVTLADPQAHYDRARAAGAEIITPLAAKDYGGSSYDTRDPGGHIWTFGDYDPFA